ncbi:MAG: hypothetical protein ACPF9K_14735, partial [Neptuniibacter sp.]
MRKVLSVFAASTMLLSGCQSIQPVTGTTTQQEGVAAIEEAIQINESQKANMAPPPAPVLLPPLDLQSANTKLEDRFDITAEALPARDFFMGLVQGELMSNLVYGHQAAFLSD